MSARDNIRQTNISQTNSGIDRPLSTLDSEALCKNRCMSSPSVIVLHMFTSGLEKRQAAGANCREISKLRAGITIARCQNKFVTEESYEREKSFDGSRDFCRGFNRIRHRQRRGIVCLPGGPLLGPDVWLVSLGAVWCCSLTEFRVYRCA
jgi:hypothetical protein